MCSCLYYRLLRVPFRCYWFNIQIQQQRQQQQKKIVYYQGRSFSHVTSKRITIQAFDSWITTKVTSLTIARLFLSRFFTISFYSLAILFSLAFQRPNPDRVSIPFLFQVCGYLFGATTFPLFIFTGRYVIQFPMTRLVLIFITTLAGEDFFCSDSFLCVFFFCLLLLVVVVVTVYGERLYIWKWKRWDEIRP